MHCERFRHCGDKHPEKTNYAEIKLVLSVTKLLGGIFQSDIFMLFIIKMGIFYFSFQLAWIAIVQ